jgi:phosphatidylinositol alpha-mannosyltransferase
MKSLSVGIVCPYSFDIPGGVQYHVRDLASELIRRGHRVSVLAPADPDTPIPDFMVSAGRSLAVRYNGSVARMAFGPGAARRVRRWLDEGDFDLIHLHEPMTPSVSMLALWQTKYPVVATFHTSMPRSRALQLVEPVLQSSLEKISARIAVSEDARRTLIEHLGGDAIIVPNGVDTSVFGDAQPDPRWVGTPDAPTVAFLGRLDEPRKGLPVFVGAIPAVLAVHPGARFLIAGRGDDGAAAALEQLAAHPGAADQVEFLGGITDEEKASLFASADVYVAPQTGGESFGIVLVEAMSGGAMVIASDLGAFRRVLDEGNAGLLFRNGDSAHLAERLLEAFAAPDERRRIAEHGREHARRFDWEPVTSQILAVYEMVLTGMSAEAGGVL